MSESYYASGSIMYEREHICVNCSEPIRYMMDQKISSTGKDIESAKRNYKAILKDTIHKKVMMVKCPVCGIFQPEMIGAHCKVIHKTLNIITIILLIIFVWMLLINLIKLDQFLIFYCYFNILSLVIRLFCEIKYSIQKPLNNKRNDEIIKHREKVKKRSKIFKSGLINKKKALFYLLFSFHVIAIILFYTPELLRSYYGDPVNYNLKNNIVGIGEQTTCVFRTGANSIKGLWKPKSVKVLYTEKADCLDDVLPQINPRSKPWANSIIVKGNTSTHKAINIILDIVIPDNECLMRKSIAFTIEMDIIYPYASGMEKFVEKTAIIKKDISIKIGTRGAKDRYLLYWGCCLFAGNILLFIAIFLLMSLNDTLKGNPVKTFLFKT